MFQNENTWLKYVQEKREDEFHRKYEDCVSNVKKNLGKSYQNHVNGKWKSSSKGVFAVSSPINTQLTVGNFQKSSREEVREAIFSAKNVFRKWERTPWQERVSVLRTITEKVADRKFDFAATISMESGKNRYEAMGEVDEAIDVIRYYCEQMESNEGFIKKMGKAYTSESTISALKPYGVWGVIGPFNFPLAIPVGMSTGALVTGNTVVFKPSSDAPLSMYRFTEILRKAELPAGVFNFVTGSGSEVGAELASNDNVSGIVFTGSKAVGHAIAKEAGEKRHGPVITEMGGKNPAIVTAKADLNKAVEGVVRSAFGYGGQKCSACSRVVVLEEVKQEFVKKLIERAKSIKIGDPTQKDVFLGPIINKGAYEKYQRFAELAGKDGKVLFGGRIVTDGELSKGFYVEPAIVDGLPETHKLMQDEFFVPILCIKTVKSMEEAVKVANGIEYGLTAGIFSEDEKEVQYFFDNIEAGVIYANRSVGATTGAMIGAQPFGGWKASGSTGKGAGGMYYLPQFMREQAQTIVS